MSIQEGHVVMIDLVLILGPLVAIMDSLLDEGGRGPQVLFGGDTSRQDLPQPFPSQAPAP